MLEKDSGILADSTTTMQVVSMSELGASVSSTWLPEPFLGGIATATHETAVLLRDDHFGDCDANETVIKFAGRGFALVLGGADDLGKVEEEADAAARAHRSERCECEVSGTDGSFGPAWIFGQARLAAGPRGRH